MRTSVTILPGIKTIGWVDCEQLPARVDLEGICGNTVTLFTQVTNVEFLDSPDCRCKTEKDCAGYTDTATLKFQCPELLPIHLHLGFVVTDTNGKIWLIGSKEPPFPKLSVERITGMCESEGAGFYYEITHVAIKSMVACLY